MAARLPFIRGKTFETAFYQSPQGGDGGGITLPPRNPKKHRDFLIGQLDAVLAGVNARPVGARDPEATREVLAIDPSPKSELAPAALGDADKDVRVIGVTESGSAIVDAPNAYMEPLRRKIDAFADDAKTTKKGARKNAPAIAPIEAIRVATEADLLGPRLLAARPNPTDLRWFEIACRGGVRSMVDTDASRRQMHRQLLRMKHQIPQEFVATEQVVFFVRLTLEQIRKVLASVDCTYEFDLAPPEVRDWLLFNDQPLRALQDFALTAPSADAPSVVLLDTGIATAHPMLAKAVLKATSVVPNNSSGEDAHGHGTQMAGVALHADDVGASVEMGAATAQHWLHSVRLLVAPHKGSASEANREFWPQLTTLAVESAEKQDPVANRPRVFTLATSYGIDIVAPTYWSHAIDRLAFNDNHGRLICVSIGNADTTDVGLIDGYPSLNLEQRVQEPAQAANALTVGAFTLKTTIPPESIYAATKPMAPAGGISPHTSAGKTGDGYGADIVLEGGNFGYDGKLPDAFIETLTTLTTGRDFLTKPLSRICMTSEATARAANLAATVWRLEPDLRPASVRALAVHVSSWTDAMETQFKNIDERIAICGLGVPNAEMAMQCALDRATVIFEDAMPNAVATQQKKASPPKTKRGAPTEKKLKRHVKFFKLPVPEELLLNNPKQEVELRVTLSYFPEPNTFRRQVSHGLDLKWDMQGPSETWATFKERINKLARGETSKATGKSFKWELGITRRSRGTVQSDRWSGAASLLAGDKHIAVVPVLGWWERRPALRELVMPFTLVVTVRAPGLDIYQPIRVAVEGVVEVSS